MEKVVKIINETGIHARPAAVLVSTATAFAADVNIEFNGKMANAKSIMNVLSMGLKKDDEIKLSASGCDAEAAVDAISTLVESGFSEA